MSIEILDEIIFNLFDSHIIYEKPLINTISKIKAIKSKNNDPTNQIQSEQRKIV